MNTLYDLIDTSDLMEIDNHSVRFFGLDIDGVEEEEGDDAIVLHIEVIDNDYGLWEWFFTIHELKTATFDPSTGNWTLLYGDKKEPYTIRIYSLRLRGNNEY